MRHRKALSRKSASALGLAIFSSLGASSLFAQTQTSVWTNGGADSNWSNAANWSPAGVPSNGNNGFSDFDVTVGAPSPTNVNNGFTIDSLTVGSAGLINILDGDALTLNGPTLTDNGTIVINPTGVAAVTQLIFAANTATTVITGTGAITLNGAGNGNAARLDGAVAQAAGHTINGNGNINANFINNGAINGNSTAGSLNIAGTMTNNSLIEATNGGSISISGFVTGGTLSTSGGGLILGVASGTLDNATNNGAINIPQSNAFNLTGTLTDNGTIVVNPTATAAVTQLIFSGGTVAGAGMITLNGGGNGNASRLDGSLTQGPAHVINGNGNINANVINQGTINGNSTLGSLNINGIITNTGILEATGGGSLAIFGLVTGGKLETSGGGVILGVGSGTLDNAFNDGTLDISAGNAFNATGTITDDGSIVINPTGAAEVTQLIFSGGTVAGTGTITLNGAGNPNASRLDGTLTQASAHTIDGNGNLNATVTNMGFINGDSTAGPLNINGNITNSGLLESTKNGVLLINGATVIGGTFNTAAGGAVQGANNGTILNVTNSGIFNIPGGNGFNVAGTLVDNGTITINSNQAVAGTSLNFLSATVSGSGTINLNDSIGTAAELTGTLTQMPSHTIGGFGQILAALTNNGTLNAATPNTTLILLNNNTTNNALIEATNAAALALQGANVTGGIFNSSSGGAIQASGSATNSVTSITNNGTFNILGGSALNLNGNITNNGTITVNADQAVAGTALNSNGATVSGSGSIVLNDNIGTTAELNGTLTQSATHTISGFGQIFATLINNGTVNGNVTTQTLAIINTTVTNNGLLESTNGGAVALQGTTLAGGTFNGVQVSGNATSAISGVTNIGPLTIIGGSALSVTGDMTDNGTIAVNPTVISAATSITFNGGTLSGSGNLILSDSINTAAALNGTLTQAVSHTISGFGQLNALLTNNGAVNADNSVNSLNVFNNVTNAGLLEATAGGSLFLVSNSVTQTPAGATTAGDASGSPSFVLLDNASITGGHVNTLSGSALEFAGSNDSVSGSITNNGAVDGVSVLATVGQITGAGALAIGSGATLRITGIAAASTVASVSVNNGSLDITNNKLVINYASPAADPVATISALLVQGRNGGTWNGGGISSSAAAADNTKFAIGYLDGDTPADITAHTVAANQMILKYTLAGDAFLENTVGFDDLVVVAQNFGSTGKDWAGGNFNYDPSGSVGFADLVAVAQNFGASSGVSEGATGGALSPAWQTEKSTSAIPEPGALAWMVVTAGSLMARRKRQM